MDMKPCPDAACDVGALALYLRHRAFDFVNSAEMKLLEAAIDASYKPMQNIGMMQSAYGEAQCLLADAKKLPWTIAHAHHSLAKGMMATGHAPASMERMCKSLIDMKVFERDSEEMKAFLRGNFR